MLSSIITGINPEDAHAIDIIYHKRCWARNVTHVHCRVSDPSVPEVEFLSLVKGELLDSKVISMGVTTCSRPKLKKLLQRKIPDVELHKAKHANEPELVSIKCTRDAAIQLTENRTDADMKALYDAASVLRRVISKVHHWSFSGSLLDVEEGHLPNYTELYSWVIQGPDTTLSSDAKSSSVNRNAIGLAHTRKTTTQTLKTTR